MSNAKKKIVIGVVLVVAIVAVSLGVTLISNSASTKSGTDSNPPPDSGTSALTDVHNDLDRGKKPSSNSSRNSSPFPITALAIGDFGVTVDKGSCCSNYIRHGIDLYKDQRAQTNIAYLMSISAKKLNCQLIIGHGDNFYYNGIGQEQLYRFEQTFEQVYNQKSLSGIRWINVMGNHDYGGSGYLCGKKDFNWEPCQTVDETLKALNQRFLMQSTYKSPNEDRWKMPARYYKERLTDPQSGLTVDIFNVDTNAANVHGAQQVCCQCYDYMGKKKKGERGYFPCSTVTRGHEYCFGGDIKLFDACVDQFEKWTQESLQQLIKDAKTSDADYKLVNSHYSPYLHMNDIGMKKWLDAVEIAKIQLFLCGHTHGESHDYRLGTHFVVNGAGGGIQSESVGDISEPGKKLGVSPIWSGDGMPYAFMELLFSKAILRIRFISFGDDWKFEKDRTIQMESQKVIHCWDIPKDGSKGKACDA
uniref:Uncharacterized protein AlNc14C229G9262 n=1 Tax=Albugo laibachii Nc14 TaxID=890382 RepID=F0WSC2_9STRA|nr:conserved hypothetical protein [Albugo laibachii Nc14]CCA25879.1 conserved hypothetical protein [Albugo laibachii Nc14]|eukprot:CCA25879.1 conserved hypothetical protein [Albugo laibachii Nc14]